MRLDFRRRLHRYKQSERVYMNIKMKKRLQLDIPLA